MLIDMVCQPGSARTTGERSVVAGITAPMCARYTDFAAWSPFDRVGNLRSNGGLPYVG